MCGQDYEDLGVCVGQSGARLQIQGTSERPEQVFKIDLTAICSEYIL
jgi:hypothetical protein